MTEGEERREDVWDLLAPQNNEEDGGEGRTGGDERGREMRGCVELACATFTTG